MKKNLLFALCAVAAISAPASARVIATGTSSTPVTIDLLALSLPTDNQLIVNSNQLTDFFFDVDVHVEYQMYDGNTLTFSGSYDQDLDNQLLGDMVFDTNFGWDLVTTRDLGNDQSIHYDIHATKAMITFGSKNPFTYTVQLLPDITPDPDPTPTPTGVPEPATWAMMLLGFGFIGRFARKQTRYARCSS